MHHAIECDLLRAFFDYISNGCSVYISPSVSLIKIHVRVSMFAFVCVLDCLRLVLVVCAKCAICSVHLLARSLVRLSDDSMRRYHLKFNSIKCSTGSTFYSIYLANCVCIRVLSDVQTAILSLAASVFLLHRCCCCFFSSVGLLCRFFFSLWHRQCSS